MIKNKQGKGQQNTATSKDLQLPLIQKRNEKGAAKDQQQNSSKAKNAKKATNSKSNLNEIPKIPNIPLTRQVPKDIKSFETADMTQSTNKSNKTKTTGEKKKKFYYYKDENKEQSKEGAPRISEEKLAQIKEQRRKRIQQTKIEEEKELELYNKLIEEYKNNSKDSKSKKNNKKNKNQNKIALTEENIIKTSNISSQKAQKILEEGGMLDAYKYVLSQLCRNGLPTGNIFEYASYIVQNYEKKWKEKKSKMMQEKIDKYYEEKQKEINNNIETEGEKKRVNKSLEHREEYKFIKSLDKSRSKIKVIKRISAPNLQDNYSSFNKNLKSVKVGKDIRHTQGKDDTDISPMNPENNNISNINDNDNNNFGNEYKMKNSNEGEKNSNGGKKKTGKNYKKNKS